MTVAKAFVTGDVVKAPEKRFTQNDTAIASFTVNIDSVSETLVRVVSYGQMAEMAANTLIAGDRVAVEGRLQVNSYKLPNGKDRKVYEINASSIEKMGANVSSPIKSDNNKTDENIVSFNQEDEPQDLIDEDEIPF